MRLFCALFAAVAFLAACGTSSVPTPSASQRSGFRANMSTTACAWGAVCYHGGTVLPFPKVYLVFWDWPNDNYQEASRLIGFLNDVGGSPWLQTVNEYYMETATGAWYIQNVPHMLKGYAYNHDAIPATPDYAQFKAEAQNAASELHLDSTYIVFLALPQGHGGYFLNGNSCGVHGMTANSIPYIVIPYAHDTIGYGCGSTAANPNISVSTTGGHELAETLTDPTESSWYEYNTNFTNPYIEIADECVDYAPQAISLSGTAFEMDPLYSAKHGACMWTNTRAAGGAEY